MAQGQHADKFNEEVKIQEKTSGKFQIHLQENGYSCSINNAKYDQNSIYSTMLS